MKPNFFCEAIADAHKSVFDGTLGCFKGVEAKIHLKEGAKLKVMPAAKVPVGISEEFNFELDKMYQEGTPIDGPGIKVASQIGSVVKMKNNVKKVRLCGTYTKVNEFIEDEPYNFPTANGQI